MKDNHKNATWKITKKFKMENGSKNSNGRQKIKMEDNQIKT